MKDATTDTKKIYDKGIEEGAKNLTPEKIQQVYLKRL